MSKNAVGKEALAYCTSCKMDLGHVIVAMTGDQIKKVQCNTCKKEHTYKAPKGVTEPGAAKPKKARKAKEPEEPQANPIEAEWEKLIAQHKATPAKPYTTKGQFILGDKIAHPTFGEGIINKLIYPNKVEVIFRTDMKVLIYGGTQTT